jgi:hypothetical protein
MLENQEPDRNIEEVDDGEINAAIHYLDPDLDPDLRSAEQQSNDNVGVICVFLYIALLGCLTFLWLYWR